MSPFNANDGKGRGKGGGRRRAQRLERNKAGQASFRSTNGVELSDYEIKSAHDKGDDGSGGSGT